jgi:Zn-dependent protease
MTGLRQGSIRLFRFAGIDVFLHWSWFLVATFEIGNRTTAYSSLPWNVLEYLAVFVIVLLHEFGHALACRQVGGLADQVVLWPLGGVAYVNPPPRPGAMLWSIAAGPLVNVTLLPILWILGKVGTRAFASSPDILALLHAIWIINLSLLIFNMLPIYPLDGGQMLRSFLWFAVGRARSLMVATILGFVGMAGFIALAVWLHSAWFGILAAFILMNCMKGLKSAQALSRLAKLPRHGEFVCPSCKAAPPIGNFWVCACCQQAFDTFQSLSICPHCAAQFSTTACLDCGRWHAMNEWTVPLGLQPTH